MGWNYIGGLERLRWRKQQTFPAGNDGLWISNTGSISQLRTNTFIYREQCIENNEKDTWELWYKWYKVSVFDRDILCSHSQHKLLVYRLSYFKIEVYVTWSIRMILNRHVTGFRLCSYFKHMSIEFETRHLWINNILRFT